MAVNEIDLTRQLDADIERRNQEVVEGRMRAAKALNIDEDRARRVMSAADFSGLPYEVVDSDLESIEQRILSDSFDPQQYKREAPAWSDFLAENPYHLAALEKDMESMGYVERSIRQIGLGWQASTAQVQLAHLTNARIRQGGEFTPEQQELYDKYSALQTEHEFGAEGVAGFLVKNAKMLAPTLYTMQEGAKMAAGGAAVGMGAALLAGQAGPQVALPEEFLTVPAAGVVGAKVGGTVGVVEAAADLERAFAYDEYRAMGMDHNTALKGANAVGVINSSLEAVGIGKAVKYIPWVREGSQFVSKKLAGDVLTRQSVKRATAMATLRFGEVLGTEVLTEAMQEAVTMVAGEVVRPEGVGYELTYEMFADRVADAALETMQGAFLISTLGPGMSYYGDLRRAHDASRMQTVFETLATGAGKSETRKTNRGAYQQFVQRLREQGAADNIYIDGERFVTYFQEKGRDPESVANELGIDPKDVQEAQEIGGDVAIPIDQYADKIAPTAAGMDLAGDLKGSTDAMSAREAEVWRKNNPKLVEAIERMSADTQETAVDAEIESIVQDVTGQLVAAGYSTGSADKLATVMRGIGVLARRANMDPNELYNRVFSGVKRITPEAKAARESVDILVDPLINRLRNHDFPSQRDMFGPSLMDFINESGGINWTDPELEAMDFQIGARELGVSQAKLNRWKKEGGTLADIAEKAAEAGYIPDVNESLLIDALRDELIGNKVFGTVDGGNQGLRDLSVKLDELASYIDEAGLDIDSMTNEEIRTALEKRETFAQIDLKELQSLTSIVMNEVLTAEETAQLQEPWTTESPVDTTLAKAQAMLPAVSETQDFGDVTISDTVRIQETGKRAKVKVSAQRQFDRAVKRKNVLKRLLDCVSG